ncbi:MAG: hypothetical protein DCF12_10725 [Snowella sp.]|nr:MAG: hypothetical protein DCF12_10725 [Snowella sp.]
MTINVETLRNYKDKATVAFTLFTRKYKSNKSALFCFFEGEDSKYYGIRITLITKTKEKFYFCCGNKSEVLKIYFLISQKEQFLKAKTAYFIDRDFDPSISNSLTIEDSKKIYETPCYSIENFYTSTSCIKEVLRSEFYLDETDQDFENCLNLYQKLQNEFHLHIGQINAYIACLKEAKEKLNLDGFDIGKFIKFNLKEITANYNIEALENKFCPKVPLSQYAIQKKLDELKDQGCQKSFRGKFEVEFLRKILAKLQEKANKGEEAYFSKKINVSLNIGQKTILSDLSQYADTPSCLHQYLESFKEVND